MKKITAICGSILIAVGTLVSCHNDDWDFPDFDYTTTYFPYQFPVRTLVLGDYNFDNSNDNAHKFMIGATMGGVYENTKDITVEFVVDESLVDNVVNVGTGNPVLAMPTSYYALAGNTITIPSGQTYGMVEVQLTDAFFADPLAIGQNYVIPLKMVSATADSILQGQPAFTGADPRVRSEWVYAPKDFTLFGVKYVNPYHGKYLMRGGAEIRDAGNVVIGEVIYRTDYLEQSPVMNVTTTSLNSVLFSNAIRVAEGTSPGTANMLITFDESGNGVITSAEETPAFPVTGTGKFVKDDGEWGNKKRDVIYLDYEVVVGTDTHHVFDTLVFRDKAVKFEEFNPSIE